MFKSNERIEGGEGGGRPARPPWRRILQVSLVVLALLDGLFFALLLKPAGERARAQREDFEKLRQEVGTRRGNLDGLRSTAGNLGDARKEAMDFYQQKFLPKPTGFSIVMEEVDKLAQANKVLKGGVGYSLVEVRNRPDLNQVDITTVLEGEYGDIVRFVNGVERSGLFLLIDSIGVGGSNRQPGPAGSAGQTRSVQLSLRLVTFFRG